MQRLAVSGLGPAEALAGTSAAVTKTTIKTMAFTLSVPSTVTILKRIRSG
jgi:hypothetical protein